MTKETKINHVALTYSDKEKADVFFNKILGLELKKTFTLSPELSYQIFGIKQKVTVFSYENEYIRFEIYITDKKTEHTYDHTCIIVKSFDDFIKKCKKHGLNPFLIEKDGKRYLFLRDFNGNLFEIKEASI
ncbi:MAG: hypothetical protein DRN07_07440 [Thermoplasmata archaeon]|nr:MAG: hypothetical protein DRN07_07440 [Thermoplasmata archaeon]